MIKRFKPEDFEECLMGLPIQNWRLVDDIEFFQESDYKEILRPKMMVTHLEPLKGIDSDEFIRIGMFSEIDILKESTLPNGFMEMLALSMEENQHDYKHLGLHMIQMKKDKFFMPYLIVLDGAVIMKSYMQERTLCLRDYKLSKRYNLYRYNEIPFELKLSDSDFEDYLYDELLLKHQQEILSFSYFMGFTIKDDAITTFKLAMKLPQGIVIRNEAIESLLIGEHVALNRHIKNEMKKVCFKLIKTLRLHVHSNQLVEKFFEHILWPVLNQMNERR